MRRKREKSSSREGGIVGESEKRTMERGIGKEGEG
jgi:hypothetical protein